MFFQCRPRHPRPPPPPRPACILPSCARKALECTMRVHGHALLSLHCKDHACRQRLGAFMCPNAKDPGSSKYCSDHARCQAENCSQTRRFADTGLAYAYCQKHTCFLEACALKRAPNSTMCAVHTPLCLVPTCHDPRSPTGGGLYCAAHTCAEPDCDAVLAGGPWCRAHAACAAPACSGTRVAPGSPLCARHLCAVRDCPGPRRDASSSYCADHACQTPGCPDVSSSSSEGTTNSGPRHCASHTCAAPDCLAPRATDGPCCPGHNAWLFDEIRPVLAPESPREAMATTTNPFPPRPRDPPTPAEEALARRLKEEEDRLRARDQLERDMRSWNDNVPVDARPAEQQQHQPQRIFAHLPDPVPWEFPTSHPPIIRRRPRTRSRDSGLGSSAWGSDRTYIS